MEVLARGFFSVTPPLDTIVASRDATILDLDVGGWMCKFTFGVRSGALVPLELSADF
jgi:hypothetical protein